MFRNIRYILKKKFFRNMMEYDVNLAELKNMQKEGANVIDVRSSTEYQEGHLDGAINIPEYEINTNFKNLNIDKNNTIILYCQSGYRSQRAYKKIKDMGYNKVYNLYGGLEEY